MAYANKPMDIVERAHSNGQSARQLSATVTVNIIQMIRAYVNDV